MNPYTHKTSSIDNQNSFPSNHGTSSNNLLLESNRIRSNPRYEFLNTMQEYIHLEKDLNTSYSLSSHIIRKLKLVRKGTFELQHEIQRCHEQQQQQQQYQHHDEIISNASESNRLHGFLMKGLEPTLNLERNDELLVLQVCQTMLETMVENIMEYEEEPKDDNDDDDEGIVTLLEWFHHVYSIMEVDVLYAIAQLSISSSCIDPKATSTSTSTSTSSWTLVRLLLHHLVPSQQPKHAVAVVDIDLTIMTTDHDRNYESKQEYKWDKKKYLSLSILSKLLLTMEYVQMFCTSCSSQSLPIMEPMESSLGEDMGIGLIREHKSSMKHLMELVLRNIVYNTQMESDMTHNSNILLTSLVFLCVLYRTNPMEWMHDTITTNTTTSTSTSTSIPIMDDVIQNLQSMVLRGVHDSNSMLQKYMHSMAMSTLLLIQHHNGNNINTQNWITSDEIHRLCYDVFARGTDMTKRNMKQSVAAQLILHLSICRNEDMMKEMQSNNFQQFMQEFSSNLCTAVYVENLSVHFLIWTYWLTYNRYHFCLLLGELWTNSNILKSILTMMTKNKSHASVLSVFLRMLLKGPSRSRDTIGTWVWNALHTDKDCQSQLQVLSNVYMSASDICRPSHLAVLQLFQDLLRNDAMRKLIWDYMNSDDIHDFIKVLNMSSCDSLQCQMCLSVASLLGMMIIDRKDDLDASSIRQALTRFASNTGDETIKIGSGSFQQGIFQYAISQSHSRDTTRRAIMLQSILMRIQDDDCIDFTNAIFYSSLDRERNMMQASDHISQCKKENELLSIKCKEMSRVNQLLSEEMKNKEISFHRELSKCRRQAQVDLHVLSDAHIKTCNGLKEKLSDAHVTLNQLKDEVTEHLESKLQLQKETDTFKSEIVELKKTLQNGHAAQNELQRQFDEKSMEIDQASKEIHDLSSKLEESKCKEQKLVEIHNDLKYRLEESLSHLITVAQIYSSKEVDHEKEFTIIKRQLQLAEMELDKANSHSRTVEEKYTTLKQKYQELKHRFEKEKQKSIQEKNRIAEEKSKKSSRKPMGTLAFMNSIHDTSLRLEKAKHIDEPTSSTSNHRSSSRTNKTHDYGTHSSRKSKFRIVK